MQKTTQKSLIKLFKVCGFLRQSLKSRSAEREKSLALQAVAVLGDSLEGKNLPKREIFSFTPRALRARNGYRVLVPPAVQPTYFPRHTLSKDDIL